MGNIDKEQNNKSDTKNPIDDSKKQEELINSIVNEKLSEIDWKNIGEFYEKKNLEDKKCLTNLIYTVYENLDSEERKELIKLDDKGTFFQKPTYDSLKVFLNPKNPHDYRPEVYDFKKQFDAQYIVTTTWHCKDKYNCFVEYFLKNRTDNEYYLIAELNYKGQNELSTDNKVTFDCDGSGDDVDQENLCWLSREIYRILWYWQDWEKPNSPYNEKGDINKNQRKLNRYSESIFSEGGKMGPDTINSFQTTFNLNLTYNNFLEKIKEKYPEKYKKQRNVSKNCIYKVIQDEGYTGILEGLDYFQDWENFANKVSSLGNFILVKEGYNFERKQFAEDYWDISLGRLMNENKTEFQKYVNVFFLWDYCYIHEQENKQWYKVKSLLSRDFKQEGYNCESQYDSHSTLLLEGGKILPTKEEIKTFLENVNWAIERRGIFMVAMLKIALLGRDEKNNNSCEWNVSPIYKKLMKKVLQEENCYESYTAVFSKIVEILNQEEKSAIKDIVLSAAEKLVCKEDLERIQKLF